MWGEKLSNKHSSVHYHKRYSSHNEAMKCWHVKTAAKHHKVNLVTLAKSLAAGINLATAVIQLLQVL